MPARPAPAAFTPLPPPPMPPQRDMDGQVKAIGAVQIVFAALAIIGAFFILFSGEFAAGAIEDEGNEPEVADMVRSIMRFLAFVMIAYGVLGIVGSIGLFTLKGWGRGMSLAFCGISLVNIPFGTALGIWGIIVLTRPETATLFRDGQGRPYGQERMA
jgi:hypothetical protein